VEKGVVLWDLRGDLGQRWAPGGRLEDQGLRLESQKGSNGQTAQRKGKGPPSLL
jgi:hypothetical protein